MPSLRVCDYLFDISGSHILVLCGGARMGFYVFERDD